MLDGHRTRSLAEAMAEAHGGAVSVKCRLAARASLLAGVGDWRRTPCARPRHVRDTSGLCAAGGRVPETAFEELAEYVDQISHTGAVSHVVVHARAAILGGLSPSKNRQVPRPCPCWDNEWQRRHEHRGTLISAQTLDVKLRSAGPSTPT